jgi:hypothetical protein
MKFATIRNSVLLSLIIWVAIAISVFGQTHQPSVTVTGRTVSFDADIMWWSHTQDMTGFELTQGTPILGPRYAASSDLSSPVIWAVPPGNYTATAYGFPDDPMAPNRIKQTLTIVVEPVSRQEQINEAVYRFYFHRNNWQASKQDLRDLDPTDAELAIAVDELDQ